LAVLQKKKLQKGEISW